MGQLPFNFEIGSAIDAIRYKPPATAHGELNVHLEDCNGPLAASLPLDAAVHRYGTTELAPARLRLAADAAANTAKKVDLCFEFTQHGLDPFWVIDQVQLRMPGTVPNPAAQRSAP